MRAKEAADADAAQTARQGDKIADQRATSIDTGLEGVEAQAGRQSRDAEEQDEAPMETSGGAAGIAHPEHTEDEGAEADA